MWNNLPVMEGKRNVYTGLACAAAMVASAGLALGGQRAVKGAVIIYSAAPWDGPSYRLTVPLPAEGKASKPAVTVDLWGNPQYAKPKTLTIRFDDNSMLIGHANYQPVLNDSLPDNLAGRVTFDTLMPGKPVTGSYELKSAKGKVFKGRFKAKWGNTNAQRIGR